MTEKSDKWSPYASVYNPINVSNIDGSDGIIHDRAIIRACNATFKPNPKLRNRPECTLFVGRLDIAVNEDDLKELFGKHGPLKNVTLIRDIATGFSKRYAFVEFKHTRHAERAQRHEHRQRLKGKEILVDFEHQHTLPGWIPRRLGGGFGGTKESGQLRFGCLDKPWKRINKFGVCNSRNRFSNDTGATRERRLEPEDFKQTSRNSDSRSVNQTEHSSNRYH